MDILILMGVPTAFTGLLFWLLKKHIDKKESKAEERERNIENLMFMIMQNSKSTHILAEATAKAVQRIPDAHCNGDMTAALAEAARIQEAEQKFLSEQGLKHIFGD